MKYPCPTIKEKSDLEFWSKLCGPCKIKTPNIGKLYQYSKIDEIEIVAVNANPFEKAPNYVK